MASKKKSTPADNTPVEHVEQEQDTPSTEHAPGLSPAPAPVDLSQLGALGQAIGNAVAAGMAQNAPPRKITFGEYQRRGGINQYHPDPKKKLKFNREYYQNGKQIQFSTCYDREVELLNQITHSGRYINRLVEIVVIQNGSEEAIDIRYSNKRDKAFELKGYARNLVDMLEQIVAAQAVEREEMEDEKADRRERSAARRAFGDSKNTREARERAGA
jgi:hypothetical protein